MKTTIPKLCFSHMGAAPGLANIHTLTPHRCGRSILDAVPVPTAQEIVGAWNAGYRRRAVRVINQHRNAATLSHYENLTTVSLNADQTEQLRKLKSYRPFMRVFGAVKGEDFITFFAEDRRKASRLIRKGYAVFEANKV